MLVRVHKIYFIKRDGLMGKFPKWICSFRLFWQSGQEEKISSVFPIRTYFLSLMSSFMKQRHICCHMTTSQATFGHLQSLKVSKNQNDFMKTSFLSKTNEIIVRISAHYIIAQGRNPDNYFVGFWEKRCLHFLLIFNKGPNVQCRY